MGEHRDLTDEGQTVKVPKLPEGGNSSDGGEPETTAAPREGGARSGGGGPVKTGDEANPASYLFLLCLAGAGMAGMLLQKRRSR